MFIYYGLGVKILRNKNQKGFTLIELLVVIAIIGLLASVVLLALNSARAKSRDAKRISDVQQMVSAFELFYNDASSYPTGTGYITSPGGAVLGSATMQANSITLTPTYLGQTPTAPLPADGNCTAAASAVPGTATNAYTYWSNGVSYTLTFCLGGQTGGYTAGGHWASPQGIQ